MRVMQYVNSMRNGPEFIGITEHGHAATFTMFDTVLLIELDGIGRAFVIVEGNVPSITLRGKCIERNKMVDVMYLLSNQTDDALIHFALRCFGHDVPIKKHAYTLPSWYEIRYE